MYLQDDMLFTSWSYLFEADCKQEEIVSCFYGDGALTVDVEAEIEFRGLFASASLEDINKDV